jgi:hypothetical protein
MINALPTDFINMPRLNLFGSQSLMTFGMHVDIDLKSGGRGTVNILRTSDATIPFLILWGPRL